VGGQGVVGHQLLGHLPREGGLQPARDVDPGQLIVLGGTAGGQLAAFAPQVGLLRIGL
jgi:hypothetical protein